MGKTMNCWKALDRTNTDDIELETALQELLLNLRGNAVETDVALRCDRGLGVSVNGCHVCPSVVVRSRACADFLTQCAVGERD